MNLVQLSPKTTDAALRYMQIGFGVIVVTAYVDYSIASGTNSLIWKLLAPIILLVSVVLILYGSAMYVRISRKPISYNALPTDHLSEINFSSLEPATVKRVTDTRFMIGLGLLLISGLVAWIIIFNNDEPLPAENIPIAIGAGVLALSVSAYMLITYFLFNKRSKDFSEILKEFAQINGFKNTGRALQSELLSLQKYTPYYRHFKLVKMFTVFNSIQGVYRDTPFSMAACAAYDYCGLIVLEFDSPLYQINLIQLQARLQEINPLITRLEIERNKIVIVLDRGLAVDQVSMRHYFNILDVMIDARSIAI